MSSRPATILRAALALAAAGPAFAAPPPLLPRQALFSDPPRAYPQVAPDGTRLGWLAPDAAGIQQVHVGDLDGRAGQAVTAEPRPVRRWLWAADGRSVLLLQDTAGEENDHLLAVELATRRVRDLTPFRGVRVDQVFTSPRRPDVVKATLNLRDPGLFDVYRIDLRTGAVVLEQKNPGGVTAWTVDPRFEVRGAARPLPDGGSELLVRGGGAGSWRRLARARVNEILAFVSFSADGKRASMLGSQDAPTARVVERDLRTGAERVLAEDHRADATASLVDPRTGAVLAVAIEHLHTEWKALDGDVARALAALRRLAPVADVVPLALEAPDTVPLSLDPKRRFLVVRFTEDRAPPRFGLYDFARREARLLFADAGAPAPPESLAELRPVVIRARDGVELPSYLALPPGVEPRSLPLVLLVHGGPWWRDSWGWHPITQWLANRGYAVLRVNYRASTGFGKAHVDAGNRQMGRTMQDDLGDAVAWAVREGFADPARVAIVGKSYGGYAALAGAALTPDLYRCAVSYVGVADLAATERSFPPYWKPFVAQMKVAWGDLDDPADVERMRAASPLYAADRIRIPLLVGQGANDVRVRKAEAEAIVAAVERQHGRATYVLYTDEGHGPAGVGPDRPPNRRDWYARVEAFLARHLGGRAEPRGEGREEGSTAVVREVGADERG